MTETDSTSSSKYRRLLCPVDFSDISRRALEWTLSFSKELQASVTLLHVIDSRMTSVGNLVNIPDVSHELRQRADGMLHEWQRVLNLSRVKIEIREGVPDQEVVNATREAPVDLLIMGTHGFGGFQRLLLGSVTEKVLHRVRVPLMTISQASALEPSKRPTRVVTAVDLGAESSEVVRHGLFLARHFAVSLVAAHVLPVPDVVLNYRTVEQLGAEELARLTKRITEERRKELEQLMSHATDVDVEIETAVGRPYAILTGLVRDTDLLVMGAGGHGEAALGWLGSVCHKMVRSAPCPVLIVR
ncbi:MAG TPA: universal stress protein [Vicinamibacteria bacterium]|nr:universal stress protein [Vicinamibacteria bacterium]